MKKYILLSLLYIPVYILAMLLAPMLPAFSRELYGPINNNAAYGVEPRLPKWLSWFDTYHDNSLYGDDGWKTKHYPKLWNSYLGMVLWLWRNPAAGFAKEVLAKPINLSRVYLLDHSGSELNVDKSYNDGWFFISTDSGLFQYRWVKTYARLQLSLELGWLLDVYIKNPNNYKEQPRAYYQLQPQLKLRLFKKD